MQPDIDKMRSKNDIKGLIKALGYKKYNVRQQAAAALGELGDARAAEPMCAILYDKTEGETIKISVMAALANIKNKTAIDALTETMNNGPHYLRKEAAHALQMSGIPEEAIDLKIKAAFVLGQWDRLVSFGADSEDMLIDALKHADFQIRREAAKALGDIGSIKSTDALISLLSDTYTYEHAARALGKIDSERSASIIEQKLKQPEATGRWRWINALGYIGGPRAEQILLGMMDGGNVSVVFALAELGSKKAVEPLKELLKSTSYFERRAARMKLIKMGEYKDAVTLPSNIHIPDTLIEANTSAGEGAGLASFQTAIQNMNNNKTREGIECFEDAIEKGLDELRKGYALSEMAEKKLLDYDDVEESVNDFLKAISYNKAFYETALKASQYLDIIYMAAGLKQEALKSLTFKAYNQLKYSLSYDTRLRVEEKLRGIVWKK